MLRKSTEQFFPLAYYLRGRIEASLNFKIHIQVKNNNALVTRSQFIFSNMNKSVIFSLDMIYLTGKLIGGGSIRSMVFCPKSGNLSGVLQQIDLFMWKCTQQGQALTNLLPHCHEQLSCSVFYSFGFMFSILKYTSEKRSSLKSNKVK